MRACPQLAQLVPAPSTQCRQPLIWFASAPAPSSHTASSATSRGCAARYRHRAREAGQRSSPAVGAARELDGAHGSAQKRLPPTRTARARPARARRTDQVGVAAAAAAAVGRAAGSGTAAAVFDHPSVQLPAQALALLRLRRLPAPQRDGSRLAARYAKAEGALLHRSGELEGRRRRSMRRRRRRQARVRFSIKRVGGDASGPVQADAIAALRAWRVATGPPARLLSAPMQSHDN